MKSVFVTITFLFISFSAFANRLPAAVEKVPALEIQKLGNYKGKYFTVIYAVGRASVLSTEPLQTQLTAVKKSFSKQIQSDQEMVPATELAKGAFVPSFNFIAVVISSNPNYVWINGDDSTPKDQQDPSSTNFNQPLKKPLNQLRPEKVFLVTADEIKKFVANNLQLPYPVDVSKK